MLARLIALLATGEAGVVKRRIKTTVTAYAVAGLSGCAALVFFILAAYLAAAIRWGAIAAAIWFGVGFAVLTAVILIIYKIVAGAQRRAQQQRRAADTTTLAGASAMAMLPAIMSKKGGATAALAVLAALAGYSAYRAYDRQERER